MKKFKFKRFATLAITGMTIMASFTSCSDKEEINNIEKTVLQPNTNPADPGRLILVYAVASNDLESALNSDMQEMLDAAKISDIQNNTVVLYSVTNDGVSQLRQIVGDPVSGKLDFIQIKTYDRLPLSVDKVRIREVIDDVTSTFSTFSDFGLILWSHASGWTPFLGELPGTNTQNQTKNDSEETEGPRATMSYSFGSDTYDKTKYNCNITDLALAIPEDTFDFIWFDCCYMGNIETLYQLREKTPYIVAYPTEIYSPGLPYDLVLPFLLKRDADLPGAAFELFKYYDKQNLAVTVSAVDTSKLSELAKAAAHIINDKADIKTTDLPDYATGSYGPFYDLQELVLSYPVENEEWYLSFRNILSQAVIAKYASEYDFHKFARPILPEKFSGISMHRYIDNNSQYSNFYRTLDWYKATR